MPTIRLVSGAFLVSGGTLLTQSDGVLGLRLGLGVWCFGALLFLDSVLLQRDGLPAQILWAIGVGAGVWAIFYTDLPQQVSEGIGGLVLASLTFGFAILAFIVPQRTRSESGEPAPPDELARSRATVTVEVSGVGSGQGGVEVGGEPFEQGGELVAFGRREAFDRRGGHLVKQVWYLSDRLSASASSRKFCPE